MTYEGRKRREREGGKGRGMGTRRDEGERCWGEREEGKGRERGIDGGERKDGERGGW